MIRQGTYIAGILLSALAILILAVGLALISTGTFGGTIIGVAIIYWYVIIGLMSSLAILFGKTPEIQVNVPANYVRFGTPFAIAVAEFILAGLILSKVGSYTILTLILMLAPPLILIAKAVLAYKGILTSVKEVDRMRFFKKIKSQP